MTRLSSIFSFKTLQGSFRPSKALVLALFVLALAEGGLHFHTPRLGWAQGTGSLEQWVMRLQGEISERKPEIWLMGNSTLAFGVDVKQLEEETGKAAIALPFANASFGGQMAMLEYFLRRAPILPQKVIFCTTKDDFHRNNERAWLSKRYMVYDTWQGITLKRIFRLVNARSTLMNLARSAIIGDDKPQRVNSDFHSSNGIVSPNWIARMGNMMKDFDLDQDTYTRVSSLTEKYGFSAEVLVMPVADSYIEFHDQNTCDLSYDELLKAIGVLCEAADLAFVDASRFASHEVEYFADPIHMTPLGREHFMHWLADRVAGRTVVHSREISD